MKRLITFLCVLLLLAMMPLPLHAQETTVTDDDVNRLANRLYCPVCPNETLDACRTQACVQWREEIRVQLQNGATEQQVIDNFIARFGQRVVGAPQDPALRALAVGVPVVIGLAALVFAVYLFTRWRSSRAQIAAAPNVSGAPTPDDEAYRAMLERDLK